MNLAEVLKLRNRGLSIFPVQTSTKVPLIKWKRLQTELPTVEEVTQWFSAPDVSVGLVTGKLSGVLLLDLDFTKHPESLKWYEEHAALIPRTWTERTKSGGLHIYFKWVPILDTVATTNTTGEIFAGVDTKGEGGYSKIAPSDGYRWVYSPFLTPLVQPPLWLIDFFVNYGKEKSSDSTGTKTDLAQKLSDIQNGNRNQSFTSIAGSLRARGYSIEEIFELLKPRATEVGFPESELSTICRSVGRYEPNARPQAASDSSQDISDFLTVEEKVEWISKPILADKSINFVAGLPDTLKTWLLIDLAIESARGGVWLGRFPVKKSKVLFIDQERFRGETQRRFKKMIAHKGMTGADIKGQLIIKTGTTTRIDLQNSFDAFRKELQDMRPNLILIDSWKTFHTKDTKDGAQTQMVLERIKELRTEFGCAFIFIHHEKKEAFQRAREERDPSYGDMEGSISLPAAAESVLTVVRQDSESSFVYHTKNNLGPKELPFVVKVTDVGEDKISVEAY